MEESYANTSILWIYNTLNPLIGCSKPEIWRLAVLYKYGGIYLDGKNRIAPILLSFLSTITMVHSAVYLTIVHPSTYLSCCT